MQFRIAPKETVTVAVEFLDQFNDFRPAKFKASFTYCDRETVKRMVDEGIDWEALTRENLRDWDITDYECTEEHVDDLMNRQDIAEALVEACQAAILGRKKFGILKQAEQAFLAGKLGN